MLWPETAVYIAERQRSNFFNRLNRLFLRARLPNAAQLSGGISFPTLCGFQTIGRYRRLLPKLCGIELELLEWGGEERSLQVGKRGYEREVQSSVTESKHWVRGVLSMRVHDILHIPEVWEVLHHSN